MRIFRRNPLSNINLGSVFVDRTWQEEVYQHIKSIDELPLVLVGGTGIGKTAIVNSLSKQLNCEIVTFVLSQMNDISDFLGYAVKDKNGLIKFSFLDIWNDIINNNILFYNKYILKKPIAEEPKKFVLFFDEYNRASSDIAFSIFSLFSDYRIKGLQLYPQVVRLIGSINPTGSYATSQDDLAFKARVGYLVVDFDMDNWKKWIKKSEYYYKDELLEFIENRPTLFHKDTEADVEDYQGILTARSFTRFMNAVHHRNGISKNLAIGTIGKKAVMELEGFLETKKSYTLDTISKNFESFSKQIINLKNNNKFEEIEKILHDIAINSTFNENNYDTFLKLIRLLISIKRKELLFSFISKISNNEFLIERTKYEELINSIMFAMESGTDIYIDATYEEIQPIVKDYIRKNIKQKVILDTEFSKHLLKLIELIKSKYEKKL